MQGVAPICGRKQTFASGSFPNKKDLMDRSQAQATFSVQHHHRPKAALLERARIRFERGCRTDQSIHPDAPPKTFVADVPAGAQSAAAPVLWKPSAAGR